MYVQDLILNPSVKDCKPKRDSNVFTSSSDTSHSTESGYNEVLLSHGESQPEGTVLDSFRIESQPAFTVRAQGVASKHNIGSHGHQENLNQKM